MYAVIKVGGKQYQVSPNDLIKIDRLAGEKGAEVSFDQVVMVSSDKDLTVDPEKLSGAEVKGIIVRQGKDKKIIVFKKKRRKGYQKKQGHRQLFTQVKIEHISLAAGSKNGA
ncbi:MAG: 50S ribosomal protein L21 [bacterium]